MTLTLLFMIITIAVSLLGINNEKIQTDLLLWPARMTHPAQYYRFLTSGFVHMDYRHLLFNMFSFYFFGEFLEGVIGSGRFAFLYLAGIVVAGFPDFIKKRDKPYYASLGASGGVAAVIFATIYLDPWQRISLFLLPGIPSILFAVGYLIFTAYMARQGKGRVNHDAHLWGSIFGFLCMIVIDPSHGRYFIDQLMHPRF